LNPMQVYTADPLLDNRWVEFVDRHPRASAFHQRGWLEALARTYGYTPLVLTTAPPGKPLLNGIVLCRVSSWITGTRLVSLPFSDHCEPLLNDSSESLAFTNWLRANCDRHQWSYVELRPLIQPLDENHGLLPSHSYCFHVLDTTPGREQIFRGLHKDSIQRKILRAEREGVSYEAGRSERLTDEFYRLLLITRRRHHGLPQPRAWFRNLSDCMGDRTQIRVARKNDRAIAAILTLRHGSSVIYKYGCSDARFHGLGGMPFLFWRLIEESKASEAKEIDFGRSDLDNTGLIGFKDKLSATKRVLTYYRYPTSAKKTNLWKSRAVRQLVPLLPDTVLPIAGGILYRHMG
jgi:lipid II:glycine glycyltransferase (peptidoglycan interpeptide bridge formation enzyme)